MFEDYRAAPAILQKYLNSTAKQVHTPSPLPPPYFSAPPEALPSKFMDVRRAKATIMVQIRSLWARKVEVGQYSLQRIRSEEHDTAHVLYQYIFIDEVGFNLVKRR
ncbi:unnamed protein product [Pleuronectes platessa]|uniref:Uncharacterized protein n=1 Tax=Pleuronectes platessa TaxID=8262 RepID=A0A9N7Z3Y8_PLEPL|nr:unnamed protein product [Pleuronectes platessa]